jgi:hypothetical protein
MEMLMVGQIWNVELFDVAQTPKKVGLYLLLCFEWVGMRNEKPAFPSWEMKHWDGKHWNRKSYTFDTGNYESFEPVAWCELPPVACISPKMTATQ